MAISAIYTLADDALQNFYDLSFSRFPVSTSLTGATSGDTLNLRVTEFQKPETGVDTYEVHYKTLKIVKPMSKTTFSNEFSFTMRIDRNYAWYKLFEDWNKAILSTENGSIGSDTGEENGSTNLRANVTVTTLSSATGATSNGIWVFHGCFPKTVPSISFSQEAGDPVTCEITFACNHMETT